MERNCKIAMIGAKENILPFKAVGVQVFPVSQYFEAVDLLKKIARDFSVIFITEDLASEINETLDRYRAKPFPVILPIPGATGSTGYGMKNISHNVEKAIGVDILNIK
ncbi:MAG: V-type sodium ATPase subunit G [Firmicutes bacterium ADurb.Bin080]|jgi:V/A-type H+/Na+-transporting ATPase subunit F|nr:V-type ATP synthase subunit F [Clostridiales bacterium]OQC14751.1 MAG: V-type sodium ATPase subunit G [Firmicutes bacterium ADurb.Bin080]